MCGIVGAVAQRNVTGILLEGMRRLEYRGYDSAGLAVIANDGLQWQKTVGKVAALEKALRDRPLQGRLGISHTRWATHGVPSEANAHPHLSGDIAVVHNGIIENHQALRQELSELGYLFASETDTEVVAHLIHHLKKSHSKLLDAVRAAISRLEGAYALGVICAADPTVLIGARSGSPLVVGVGIEENFIASDQLALRQVTDRFIFLEEGDLVALGVDSIWIENNGAPARRELQMLTDSADTVSKGLYRHYMLKEIFEQPAALIETLHGRISEKRVLPEAFGHEAATVFKRTRNVHIVACGTSYHAGLVAKYWMEDWAGIPCHVEVASEYRYRKVVVPPETLLVTISQSGETADTLAALREATDTNYLASLAICNVRNSSLVREADLSLMTNAGPEIGVASTKAFTTQLVAVQLLVVALGRYHRLDANLEEKLVRALHQLPELVAQVLRLNERIQNVFEPFTEMHNALFLGRGVQYPVALEGALKLKEISYIHAEAYPSGELKHGPLALVDAEMPVVAVAPNNDLLEKLKSNLHEVQARGGQLYVFADSIDHFLEQPGLHLIELPHVPESLEAIIYTLPLQLLAYHVAVGKGTDVDQPRNLAKSVTVE